MSPKQWVATNGYPRTWSAASLGVAYCGVDLVNDTDTTMVVDSVMVVPNGERSAEHVDAARHHLGRPVAGSRYGEWDSPCRGLECIR
ncbi:MAG: hypothetical protein ACOH1Y_16190 [Propionicimonas sp.]